MRPTGPCALCNNVAPLCESHIIPEFLFKTLYDDKHRFHQLSISDYRSRLLQKGMREYLLCEGCEGKFSRWETYARSVIVRGAELRYTREGKITWVSGIEYEPFKLFEMSILWRAGVATVDFFRNVRLGPHEERLRKMLLAGEPGPPWRYGCMIAGTRIDGRPSTGMMIEPTPIRLDGLAGVRFIFGGFTWGFLVSSHRPVFPSAGVIFLQRDGRLPIIVGDLEDAPFFQEMMARGARARAGVS